MTDAFQQIQECWKDIHGLMQTINTDHTKSNVAVNAINKIHEKAKVGDKLTNANKQKLKNLYTQAINESESEEVLIRKALEKIHEIRAIKNERRIQAKNTAAGTIRRGALMKMLQTSAQTLPLWIGKPGEKPPPLCGAIPPDFNYIAKVGSMVACLMKTPNESDENWILAEVVNYNSSLSKYEVADIDEEQTEKIILSRRRVIPLPTMRANPITDPEALHKKDTMVIALYPQTTCFYKAIINSPPTAINDDYEVLFYDESYTEGVSPPLKISQRYVIVVPGSKDRKTK